MISLLTLLPLCHLFEPLIKSTVLTLMIVDTGFGYPYLTRLGVQTKPKWRFMSLAFFLSLNNVPSHFTHPLFLRDHALMRLFPFNSLVPWVIAMGVPEDTIYRFCFYAIDIIYDSWFFKTARREGDPSGKEFMGNDWLHFGRIWRKKIQIIMQFQIVIIALHLATPIVAIFYTLKI